MNYPRKILVGFFLIAGLAHGCSKPAESQRDGLVAQKECLINELSDQIAEILDEYSKGEGNENNSFSRDQWPKVLKLSLSSLCGALERKEATDTEVRDLLVRLKEKEREKKAIHMILSFLTNGTAETSDLEEFIKGVALGLKLEESNLEELNIDLLCNRVQDLVKVIKQIRELD